MIKFFVLLIALFTTFMSIEHFFADIVHIAAAIKRDLGFDDKLIRIYYGIAACVAWAAYYTLF